MFLGCLCPVSCPCQTAFVCFFCGQAPCRLAHWISCGLFSFVCRDRTYQLVFPWSSNPFKLDGVPWPVCLRRIGRAIDHQTRFPSRLRFAGLIVTPDCVRSLRSNIDSFFVTHQSGTPTCRPRTNHPPADLFVGHFKLTGNLLSISPPPSTMSNCRRHVVLTREQQGLPCLRRITDNFPAMLGNKRLVPY